MLIKYGELDVTDRLLEYKISGTFAKGHLIGNVPTFQLDLKFDNYDGILNNLDIDEYWEIQETDASLKKYFKVYDQPEKYTKMLSLKLYDDARNLDIAYDTKLVYPVTVADQIDEIATLTGFVFDVVEVPEDVLTKEIAWYDNTIVVRNYLEWIAEISGANLFAVGKGSFKFELLSNDIFTSTDTLTNYEKNELYKITRVYAENGLNPLIRGNITGNTLFLDPNNLYADDQIIIDRIYAQLNGLEFYSVKSIEMISIDNLIPGKLINYNNDFKFMVIDMENIFKGGQFLYCCIDGTVTTKNEERIIKRINNATKIRKLQVKQDQEELRLSILAESQENLESEFGKLEIGYDQIKTQVEKSNEDLYKFETGSGNIFDNCNQFITKDSSNTEKIQSMDMPLGINKDYMTGKDICISADIYVKNGIIGSLEGYCGAEFDIGYEDGTKETYAIRFYAGQLTFQYSLNTGALDFDKRIYAHYKLPDKEISSVSNLRIIANMNAEKIIISYPKVEFGTYPTGLEFDTDYVRDSIVTLNRDYTQIVQNIDSLLLQAVSLTEEITTIKGDVSTVETRLQSAEIKLQPTNILMAVNEKIGADGTLYTTKFVLDKNGVHISGGGLDILNNAGTKVFYADTSGNLVIRNLTAENGTFSGTVEASNILSSEIKSGTIGGWTVNESGLTNGTAKIDKNGVTNIYTWADLYIIRLIIMGTVTADSDMISHYDFNGDGSITSADYMNLKNRLKAL